MLIYKDIFKIAIRGLLLNKIRFILSLLGIIIGIAGVVGIITIGEGGKKKVNEFVNQRGADIVVIDPSCIKDDKDIGRLKERDISFIKRSCPSALEITEIFNNIGIEYPLESGEMVYFDAKGVEPQFAKIAEVEVIRGRFISQAEVQERRRVCVIEQTSAIPIRCKRNLKIGDYLTYGGKERLKIIGFVKTKKICPIEHNDQLQAYWPISTAKEMLARDSCNPDSNQYNDQFQAYWPIPIRDGDGDNPGNNQTVYLQSTSPKKTKQLLKEVEKAIKIRNSGRIPSNLQPYIYESLVEEGLKEVKRTTLIMFAIALIALIVGGIGIMNVMYISVMERIKEIGIRRAVGANGMDIILQFLTEAVFLCLSGGIMGIIAGIFVAYYFMPFFDIPFVITWPPIVVGLLSASIVGIVSGLKPAIKASKLDPVEILR
ncbi:MAG: ABC transporter permease [Candidatus Desantisbacteria bacterium]